MHPLSKSAGNERGGDDGEFHLEESEERQRNSGSGKADLGGLTGGRHNILHAATFHHKKIKRVADDMADIVTESEAKAEDNPDYTDKSHYDKTL